MSELDRLEVPDLRDRLNHRTRFSDAPDAGPGPWQPAGGGRRSLVIVAALAIFVAAGIFAWEAFGPATTTIGSSSPTPPPGMSVYTDPLGWTAFYPSQWSVSTLQPADGLSTGVRIQNLAYLQTSPLDNGVVLTITHPFGATPDPSAGSSSFPLTAADFKVNPGGGDTSSLEFTIDGVRYNALLHLGPAASKADVAAMEEVIASIRPPSSASTSSDAAVFIAVDPTIPNMYMQALFKGPIVVRNGCVLMGGVSGSASLPIWPYGSTAVEDSGHVVIKDANGNIVASEGQEISMGGGYVAEFQPEAKVPPEDDQVAQVEQALGYPIPDRCLAGIYGIWQVGQIETPSSSLTSVSGSSMTTAPSSTPINSTSTTFAKVTDLAAASHDAGLGCDHLGSFIGIVQPGEGIASCNLNGETVWISVYRPPATLPTGGERGMRSVRGENWLVSTQTIATANAIQEAIGGS